MLNIGHNNNDQLRLGADNYKNPDLDGDTWTRTPFERSEFCSDNSFIVLSRKTRNPNFFDILYPILESYTSIDPSMINSVCD